MDYDRIAEISAKARQLSSNRRARVIGELLTLVENLRGTTGGELVDLGSGTGDSLLRALVDTPYESVTCLDKSWGMLCKGRELAGEFRNPANYVIGTIEHLPFAARCYDVALMNSVVHHIVDLKLAIESTARVLRFGGGLGIYTLSHDQLQLHHLARFFPRVAALNVARYPPIDLLVDILDASGYSNIQVKTVEFVDRPTIERYIYSITNRYGSVLHLLTKNEFETGLEALMTHIHHSESKFLHIDARYTLIGAINSTV